MTNDTSTLMGALKEAGETLAANLTTQGVPSTWDEGLTTLIGKVLDITPGPGPTPTPSSISLTADKSILSYADSESATLSATVLDGSSNPLEDITVEFFKGSVSLGTATTNSSGVATKTYASAGSGDVSFTAEVGSLSSETYTIEDCAYWNATGISFTSSSTTDRQESTGIEAFEFTPPTNWELSFDITDTSNSKRLYFVSKSQSTGGSNKYGFGTDVNFSNNNANMVLRTTSSNQKLVGMGNNPSHIVWEVKGTTVKGYVDGTLARTDTVTWLGTYAPFIFKWGIWQTGTVTATNIKIKPLTV